MVVDTWRATQASAYVARLLWSKLSMSKVEGAMVYAQSTGNRSIFGSHFALWGHQLSGLAIDLWQQRAKRVAAGERPVAPMVTRAAVDVAAVSSTGVPVAAGAVGGPGSDALCQLTSRRLEPG